MRERALEYLACPSCRGDLALVAEQVEDGHVMEGRLDCRACAAGWPVHGGVPRFAGDVDPVEQRTAAAFGYEWTRYAELAERYRAQFLDWIRPVEAAFFRDRLVLEGGCGKGRHTTLAASFGARDVVAVDLGHAVDAAFANTRALPNVHIVQADLKRPPVRSVFDYTFSVGVLHHLPVPQEGFRSLVSCLRPGGAVSAWVYGREGNGWIVHLVSPVRERITSRLPHALVDALAGVLTVPLFLLTRGLYGPLRGRRLGSLLPYGAYLGYIAPFPFREQRSIVLDHLVAPVAHYIARPEFERWFREAGLEAVQIAQHNRNSWRGLARVPVAGIA